MRKYQNIEKEQNYNLGYTKIQKLITQKGYRAMTNITQTAQASFITV